METNTLGNVLIFLYVIFFCFPSFMYIMSDNIFGMGCFGIVCLFVGFPGTLIALIVKIAIGIKEENEETKRSQAKYEEGRKALDNGQYSHAKFIFEELKNFKDSAALASKAEQLYNAEKAAKEKKLQERYNKLRTTTYPNSERMLELLGIINSSSLPPHTIEIRSDAITIFFEDKTKIYNFLSRGFERFSQNEQDAFADALCAKLKYHYEKVQLEKFHERTNIDEWDFSVWSEHLGYKLVLKPTKRD